MKKCPKCGRGSRSFYPSGDCDCCWEDNQRREAREGESGFRSGFMKIVRVNIDGGSRTSGFMKAKINIK